MPVSNTNPVPAPAHGNTVNVSPTCAINSRKSRPPAPNRRRRRASPLARLCAATHSLGNCSRSSRMRTAGGCNRRSSSPRQPPSAPAGSSINLLSAADSATAVAIDVVIDELPGAPLREVRIAELLTPAVFRLTRALPARVAHLAPVRHVGRTSASGPITRPKRSSSDRARRRSGVAG